MSAIGQRRFEAPSFLSAHADYRPNHYFFHRVQPPALAELEWEDRAPPLRSWLDVVKPWYVQIGIALVCVAALTAW